MAVVGYLRGRYTGRPVASMTLAKWLKWDPLVGRMAWMRNARAASLFLLLVMAAPSFARQAPETAPLASAGPSANPQGEQQKSAAPAQPANQQPEKPKRLFHIIPLYNVTFEKNPSPLTPAGKFRIFERSITDPFTIVSTAAAAGVDQAEDHFPAYGQGAAGYGKRFGQNYGDVAIGGFFTTYAFPSLLREDPRYFRKGEGRIGKRLVHAIANTFVTPTDSRGRSFNWANVLGRLTAGSAALAYYPAAQRTAPRVFARFGYSIGNSIVGNILSEFGPDVERWLFKRTSHDVPGQPAPN